MVQYQIQFKPVHPVTNQGVTNKTLENWTGTVAAAGVTNPNYDMALMFMKTSSSALTVNDFKRIDGEIWVTYAVSDSIKGAMKIAKPLIEQYGVDNVQICKVAPASVQIVFSESN